MHEHWVCQVCRSLNRPGTTRCYHCRERFGTPAPVGDIIRRGATAPDPVLARAAASGEISAGYGTYGSYTEAARVAEKSARRRAVPLVGRLRRPRVLHLPASWTTAGYTSAWRLGYMAAAALVALLAAGALLVAVATSPVLESVRDRTPDALTVAFRGTSMLGPSLAVFVAVGTATLILFSIFVAATTRNVPLLGANAPAVGPRRAATCWPNLLWAHARIAFLLVVPAALYARDYGIVGGIIALILLDTLNHRIESLSDWLTRPYRHIVELSDRLELKGGHSWLARAWQAAFIATNALLVATEAIPLAIVVSVEVGRFRHEGPALGAQDGLEMPQLAVLALVGLTVAALAFTTALLVPLTVQLASRQRVRRKLIMAGLTRPWSQSPYGTAYVGDGGLDWERQVARLDEADGTPEAQRSDAASPNPASADRPTPMPAAPVPPTLIVRGTDTLASAPGAEPAAGDPDDDPGLISPDERRAIERLFGELRPTDRRAD